MTDKTHQEFTPKYRPDIDGLRAIAVLSVIGFHAFPQWISGGFIGVDIFFVISGHLISSIIFSNLENGSFSLAGFYSRRIKRIFPAFITLLITLLVIGLWVLPADQYAQLGKHIAGGAAFISNFILYKESGYFDTKANTKPLLHLWSLAIEEQFYVFWPLMLAIVWRRKWSFLYITTAIAILSFISYLYLIPRNPSAAFYLPISRFWELMVGGILAYLTLHKQKPENKSNNIQASIGIVLIITGLLVIKNDNSFLGWWLLLPTVGAFFIISSGQEAWFNKFVLSNRSLVWVGLISYPLYLWHWPLLSFVYYFGKGLSIPLRLTAVATSFLLAWMTFNVIEKPIRYGKYSNAYLFILIALMSALGLRGYYIYSHKGLNRYVYAGQNLDNKPIPAGILVDYFNKNNWANSWANSAGCAEKYLRISHDCKSISPAPPAILLIGDSHSQPIYLGLVDLLGRRKGNIMRLGTYLPFYNTVVKLGTMGPESIADETNKEIDFAINSKSAKTIIIAFRGVINLTATDYVLLKTVPVQRSIRIIGNNSTGNLHKTFELAMRNTLLKLYQSHKKVIFIIDVPELGFDPRQCFDLTPGHINKIILHDQCSIPRKEFDKRNAEYRTLVFSVLKDYPDIQLFDPASKLCNDQWCSAIKDGKILYEDDNHLSIDGSRFIDKYLVDIIK